MDTKKPMGGARPGAGRKPTVADAPATSPVTIKMSEAQKEKLKLLGGAQWVRDKIDDVKLTPAKKKILETLANLSKAKEPPKK